MINNTFKDSNTGLAFSIPFHRQLTGGEASSILSLWIEHSKEFLFYDWKSRKENAEWNGDEEQKKADLFTKAFPAGNPLPILLFGRSSEED
jgi:hypothetical protein